MGTTLYYVVERQLEDIDGNEETTGWKTITVYEIANDIPKMWFDIECTSNKHSESMIQHWLNDNGFGERQYKFKQL